MYVFQLAVGSEVADGTGVPVLIIELSFPFPAKIITPINATIIKRIKIGANPCFPLSID